MRVSKVSTWAARTAQGQHSRTTWTWQGLRTCLSDVEPMIPRTLLLSVTDIIGVDRWRPCTSVIPTCWSSASQAGLRQLQKRACWIFFSYQWATGQAKPTGSLFSYDAVVTQARSVGMRGIIKCEQMRMLEIGQQRKTGSRIDAGSWQLCCSIVQLAWVELVEVWAWVEVEANKWSPH